MKGYSTHLHTDEWKCMSVLSVITYRAMDTDKPFFSLSFSCLVCVCASSHGQVGFLATLVQVMPPNN